MRPQLANVGPSVLTGDDNVELLDKGAKLNSLTHSAEQDLLHVADLIETSADQIPVAHTCDDGEFDHFVEVQER